MGVRTANISRDIFNEQKEYIYPIAQQGPNKPLVDADFNDGWKAIVTRIRRAIQILGDGSPNNGFLIAESGISNVNNFKVTGGDGTLDGAGRISILGLLCLLVSDIEFNTAGTDGQYIHAVSTGLTSTKLTDSSARWNTNELAGRTVIPDTTNGTSFNIASNTATEIVISAGDMTTVAAIGDNYRVDPSTPGAPRVDLVYLDLFIDEIDGDEDINLKHPLPGGFSFVSALRDKLRHIVKIREGSTSVPSSGYVDADGNIHYYISIAELNRDANNTITTAEITDKVSRDLYNIAAIRAEIIAARGSKTSLDARLDIVLNEDGTLKNSVVSSANIVDDTIVNADINSAAAIVQTKIDNSASYDDTYTGVPVDIEDDLNRIRNEIKVTKGTATWETTPTDDLEGVVSEVQTARGSLGSLDTRLDISLNENGTLKNSAVIYKFPRIAAEQALVFYPKDGSWSNTYRLHQFRGQFLREYGAGATVVGPYVNFDLSHGSYPIDIVIGGAAGPGGSDNQAASQTFAQKWMYIYLIGKDDGSIDLVSSDTSNTPFAQGPLLDNSVYDFPTNGWKYWKLIGALRNRSAIGWEIVPIRKIGNHASYETAELVLSGGAGTGGWVQLSIASRIPETSMRANLCLVAEVVNAADTTLSVRPASVVAAGETMLLQDTAVSGPTWKLEARTEVSAPGDGNHDSLSGWVDTDDAQRIDYNVLSLGGGNP